MSFILAGKSYSTKREGVESILNFSHSGQCQQFPIANHPPSSLDLRVQMSSELNENWHKYSQEDTLNVYQITF